ncbi:uncharacterized protein V6R79_022407 [Siganus canaliculatus]
MKVVGCARDVEKIQKLAVEFQSKGHSGGVLVPIKGDLSSEEQILTMFAAIKEQHEGVDVCIDNAGLAQVEPLLNGKTSAWNKMMDVNILALLSIVEHMHTRILDLVEVNTSPEEPRREVCPNVPVAFELCGLKGTFILNPVSGFFHHHHHIWREKKTYRLR